MSEGSNKSGYFVSAAMHGALLWLLMVSLARAPKFEDQSESIPVDTLTQDQFNQIMHGERNAPPARAPVEPPPRPVAAEPPPAPMPPEPPPEIKQAEEAPAPPPRPVETPPPPKPVADIAPESPVKPKPPEKPKDPAPEKKAEATPKPPVKEKTADAPKTPAKLPKPFDLTAIAKLVKTADATPTGATQGLPDQHAERMSPSLLAALDSWMEETYRECWLPPPSMPDGESYAPAVRVELNPDGSLSGQPKLMNPPQNPAWRAHAESAVRAALKCNPLRVPEQFAPYYQQWKSKTIHFVPQDAMG